MNIHQITDKLNQLAVNTDSFRNLQKVRFSLKALERPRTYKVFSKSTVFNGKDAYAFHDGGRSELQFNIGVEYLNDAKIFRYGIGFSLEPNQSQPDPINYLTPKIYAFNEFVKNNVGVLDRLHLWHYDPEGIGSRTPNFPVSEIPEDWIKWKNFIFIGQYFTKPIEDLNEDDLAIIINLFDRLMPVYEYVEREFLKFKFSFDGERISRICWNDNGWIQPSGRKGKSSHPDSHEGIYGYGHEEWLCDTSKILDGFHYGFLESIRGSEDKAAGKKYNIELFSINGESGNRYAVGKISNVEIIDSQMAMEVKDEYERRGWINEMENQVIAAGATDSGFSRWPGLNLFNIRFRLKDLHMFESYRLINDKRIGKIHRYELIYKSREISVEIPVDILMTFNPDTEREESDGEIESTSYERKPEHVENLYLHKKIRNALKNHLIDEYGFCIGKECPTGQGTLVDLIRELNGNRIFYEIKAYNSIRSCIREALGQLLEYSFWPDCENAKVMVIVGIMPMTEESRSYLRKLRQKCRIPVYYQQFDIEANRLVDGDFSDGVLGEAQSQ